jgi:hypothetical protein
MVDYSRKSRESGNPNQRNIDREASRIGRERSPDDIPKQDAVTRRGIVPGNVDPFAFKSSTVETGGKYTLGGPRRPKIVFDNGFLVLGKRSPDASDYVALAKWRAMLVGGEALRPDLTDALAAYRHFLDGNGQRRLFSYDRYVMNDTSGRTTLREAILEFEDAVIELWTKNGQPRILQITGPAIPCGADPKHFPYIARHFPYPASENWQKAIGSHFIWLSGNVEVRSSPSASSMPVFKATMTLHAEDRYNFNPGAQDIATGIADSDNGLFEQTGLAHQYDHFATLVRLLEWKGLDLGVSFAVRPNTISLRQPRDNHRLRNRI